MVSAHSELASVLCFWSWKSRWGCTGCGEGTCGKMDSGHFQGEGAMVGRTEQWRDSSGQPGSVALTSSGTEEAAVPLVKMQIPEPWLQKV